MAGVPQFGNWENSGNVPYTAYFEKARKGKGGAQPIVLDEPRPMPMDTPENYGDRPQKHVSDSSFLSGDKKGSGDPQKITRASAGSEKSMENLTRNSPLHGKAAGSGSGSASPYRSHGYGSSTPGRSKLKQNEEVRERSTAVPKFGEWDEQDPSAGDNYTAVFGRLKNERHGSDKSSEINQSMPPNQHGRTGNSESSGCSCFSWFKR